MVFESFVYSIYCASVLVKYQTELDCKVLHCTLHDLKYRMPAIIILIDLGGLSHYITLKNKGAIVISQFFTICG